MLLTPDSSVSGELNCSFSLKKVPRSPGSIRIKWHWVMPVALDYYYTSCWGAFPSKHRSAAPTLQLVCTGIHSLFLLLLQLLVKTVAYGATVMCYDKPGSFGIAFRFLDAPP